MILIGIVRVLRLRSQKDWRKCSRCGDVLVSGIDTRYAVNIKRFQVKWYVNSAIYALLNTVRLNRPRILGAEKILYEDVYKRLRKSDAWDTKILQVNLPKLKKHQRCFRISLGMPHSPEK